MEKQSAISTQYLTQSHVPPAALIEQARQIEGVENYFVGLPDSGLTLPQNPLLFCSNWEGLTADHAAAHQRYLLVFNLETEAVVLLDGLFVRLAPGQALLVFPFQAHRYLLPDRQPMAWLFATFELPSADSVQGLRNTPVVVPAEAWSFVGQLIADYRRARVDQKDGGQTAALLAYLLLRLAQLPQRSREAAPLPRLTTAAHRVVEKAAKHVERQLQEPGLAAADLAAATAVSPGYLRACFQRVLGIPVTVYLRQTRVHAACSLLSRTESSITEIAEHCGFSSISAFSRAFKHEIGMSPSDYRRHLWRNRNRL